MLNSQKYFLVVAEELNIARAAKKVFISQQCLSNHIKRLEEHYGVQLFNRKPRMALTKAGALLASTLHQIQILESNLDNELSDVDCGDQGVMRLGMHTSRAQILLPIILPLYKKKYPNVELHIYSDVAREMEQMLLKGQLDLFIGNHPAAAPGVQLKILSSERVYLVISDSMLQKYFPSCYPACKEEFKKGVNIVDFADVPFVMNRDSSNLRLYVDTFFAQMGIKPKSAVTTNITEMHYQFSANDYGASFCPGMMLALMPSNITAHNLNVFPIKDYTQRNNVVLAYLKDAYIPRYIQDFMDIVVDLCCRIDTENLVH